MFTPRLPSLKRKRETQDKPVSVIGLDAFLDTNPDNYGLSGSATQVERIFPPENDVEKEMWTGGDLAEKLFDHLNDKKLL